MKEMNEIVPAKAKLLFPITMNYFDRQEEQGYAPGELLASLKTACEILDRPFWIVHLLGYDERFELLDRECRAALSIFETIRVFLKKALGTQFLHNELSIGEEIKLDELIRPLKKLIQGAERKGDIFFDLNPGELKCVMDLAQNYMLQKKLELKLELRAAASKL